MTIIFVNLTQEKSIHASVSVLYIEYYGVCIIIANSSVRLHYENIL